MRTRSSRPAAAKFDTTVAVVRAGIEPLLQRRQFSQRLIDTGRSKGESDATTSKFFVHSFQTHIRKCRCRAKGHMIISLVAMRRELQPQVRPVMQ